MFQNFWQNVNDAVFDVKMTDVDANTYDTVSSKKCLAKNVRNYNKNYFQVYLVQKMHFISLIFSVNGMMVHKTKAFIEGLGKYLATKLDRPFL